MIALGVTPGISSVGYCVLEYNGNCKCDPLDADILPGSRLVKGELTLAQLVKRFQVHRMLLSVVWERHLPLVLAIGPPAGREPPVNAETAAGILASLGVAFGVPVIHVSRKELQKAFHCNQKRKLAAVVGQNLLHPIGSRDKRLVAAAATAMYGVAVHGGGEGLLSAGLDE